MTDEEKQTIENEKKEADAPKDLVMTIVRHPNGQVTVNFPLIGDKMLTYAFLKIAEKVIDKFYDKLDGENNIPPKGGIRNFIRGLH